MDAAQFDDFYARSFPRIVGQVYAMTGSLAEAQDCVQEAFVKAWQHRGSLDGGPGAEAWIRTTAWRLAISRWRRVMALGRLRDRSIHRPVPAIPDVDNTALMDGLRQLSPEYRRAVVLHYLCDMSIRDIAAETGAPEGTVKARLARARASLAELIAIEDEELAQ